MRSKSGKKAIPMFTEQRPSRNICKPLISGVHHTQSECACASHPFPAPGPSKAQPSYARAKTPDSQKRKNAHHVNSIFNTNIL